MAHGLQSGSVEPRIGRLIRLDGLRGVLAVYVLLGHTAPFIAWPPSVGRVIEVVVGHGLAAVNLFFALSGLVIVQSIARFGGRARQFLAARARRLLPVYLPLLALATVALVGRNPLAAMPWIHPGDIGLEIWETRLPHALMAQFGLHLVLLQGLVPRGVLADAQFSLLAPAWSLSTEWQFYLLIALLSVWIGSDRRGLARLVWIFLGIAVLAEVYAWWLPGSWQFHRAFLPNEAAYFAIGIAAARLWHGSGLRLFGVAIGAAMLIGGLHGVGTGMIGKALPPLIWAAAVAVQRLPSQRLLRPIGWLLGHPVCLWLGAISYPLYLVNELVGREFAVLVGRAVHGDALYFGIVWGPLTLVTSIAMAALLHYTVELRFMARRARPPAPEARPGSSGPVPV